MGGRRIAVVLIAAGLAVYVSPVRAGPDDEIEMEPDTGSGSGSGSAKPAPKPPDAAPDATKPAAPVKDPKAAKKWLFTAQQLVLKGDYLTRMKKPDDAKVQYDNAFTAMQKAIETGDDVNVYFELAALDEKLGKIEDAAKHYRVVIKAGAAAKPDVLKKATAKFEEVSAKVGLVTLAIKPEGATVSLAGVELGKAPLPDALVLMPGTYKFSIAADGFQPKETELTVEAGSESERAIELEPVKIIVEPIKPHQPDEPDVVITKPPSKLPLYVGGGAAAGLIGIATVTGLLAVGQHGTFTAGDSSNGARADAKTNGQRLAKVTDVCLVGALLAGGFTAYWWQYKYKPAQKKFGTEKQPRPPAMSAKATVVPWVQSDVGGFSLAGWF
jgi:tetratricopeptide (TPR) repeat protein